MQNLQLTQQEIEEFNSKVSMIEILNEEARECDFQSALRGIDIVHAENT